MDTYKDYLSAALSEAVIRLIDTIDQPSPFRCDGRASAHPRIGHHTRGMRFAGKRPGEASL